MGWARARSGGGQTQVTELQVTELQVTELTAVCQSIRKE